MCLSPMYRVEYDESRIAKTLENHARRKYVSRCACHVKNA